MWCVVHRQTQLFVFVVNYKHINILVNYKQQTAAFIFFCFVSKIKVYLFIEISFFQLPIIYVM